ncbi:hypothetical protein AGOR_G00057930 [Albula goreensis]|uniref:Fibronectin type-III domain-containing protein n=1 Tax=Albula goreensis TaxID=1534307 RepID=A0A8T3DR03_9TELE|nr:hypothetical protein AGOR_G00057930 [Albula goreensis]
MIYIFFTIYVLHQCCQALGLPAPVSVKMESHNFEHILRWKPGPGTPPHTTYKIKYSCPGVRPQYKSGWEKTTLTMLNLTTNLTSVRMQYTLQVRALSGGQQSPWSLPHTFKPISHTVLGPPEVSVSGCGDCLRLNISFPRGRAPQSILEIYKEFEFSIFWNRDGESQSQKETTVLSQREINHLHRGVNPIPKTHIPAVLASVSVSLILVGGALLALVYTGFLCKTKTSLPRTLTSLLRWYPLIVDDTVLDPVSLVSELGGNGAKAHQQRDGGASDEEEEVEGEDKGYETRSMGAGLSSASERSSAAPLTSHTSTPEDSGNCSACRSVAEEMGDPLSAERLGQRERGTEGALTSKGVEGEEDQQEEEQGSCGDINLLSVTLAAQEEEEEEEEEEEDSWTDTDHTLERSEEEESEDDDDDDDSSGYMRR